MEYLKERVKRHLEEVEDLTPVGTQDNKSECCKQNELKKLRTQIDRIEKELIETKEIVENQSKQLTHYLTKIDQLKATLDKSDAQLNTLREEKSIYEIVCNI